MADNNDNDKEENIQARESQKINIEQLCDDQKVNTKEFSESKKVNTKQLHEDQQVNTNKTHHSTSCYGKSRKLKTVEYILSMRTSHTSCSSRTVKISAKVQEAKNIVDQEYLSPMKQSLEIEIYKLLSLMQSSEIEKRKLFSPTEYENSKIEKRKPLFSIERTKKIENLVIQLMTLLDN